MSARSPILAELRATVALAAPLAAANVVQLLLGFTDTVMVGRLGGFPLAAAGLGAGLYFTLSIILHGVLSAVSPLAAHALGRGDRRAAGRVAAEGLGLALLVAIPVMLAIGSLDRLLAAIGYDPPLAAEVGRFLHAILWGAPAILLAGVLRGFLTAAGRTRPVLVVLMLCVPVNAALNWVLIYGNLGAPALGVAGSGYASAIVQWLGFVLLALYVVAMPSLAAMRPFAGIFRRPWREMRAILRLGLPIGGIYALETGVFATTGIMMGLLGPAALGAHQVALNFAGLTFMVPLGIGQAATARIAFELGAGRPAEARRAGRVALALGLGFMAATATGLWCFPRAIVGLYVDAADPGNAVLVGTALHLLAIAAAFQVFDGVQTIAAGVLRGYKDTTLPMLLAAIGYWGIGFVGGWLLAFPLGWGPVGLWWGLALGLAVVALLLAARFQLMGAASPAAASPTAAAPAGAR
jgi:MATE family multidrug resistance protein